MLKLDGLDTFPLSAASLPAKSFNKVDLPAPFLPTKPIRSPGLT